MSSLFFYRRFRPNVVALCLFPGIASLVEAQPKTEGAEAQALAAHRRANADAKVLAASGDIAGAARILDNLSTAPASSANRYTEIAQRLTLLANALARSGNALAARKTAIEASKFFAAADRQTTDPDAKAAIQSQIGFLQERFLGDPESAKAAYRSAARLAPRNASTREKSEAAEQAEANTRQRAAESH